MEKMAGDAVAMNTITYNIAVCACEKSGEWLDATVLMSRMRRE